MTDICYLCGDPITEDQSQDHIPPKQFFAPQIRKTVNLSKLITLPTHGRCNKAFGRDEAYFVWALAPLAAGTTAADALNAFNASTFRSGQSVGLGLKTLGEFEVRPSGLYLPSGLVVKRLEGKRITRVAWKIVRGLYCYETGSILPESTGFFLDVIEPSRSAPSELDEFWEAVKAQKSKGTYGGIFDYKYLDAQAGSEHLHGWGMLLWDKMMIFVGHLHPPNDAAEQAHAADDTSQSPQLESGE